MSNSYELSSLVTYTRMSYCIDFGINNIDNSFENSLQSALEEKIKTKREHDYFYLLDCASPGCNAIHAVRYFFTGEYPSAEDILAIKLQVNQVLFDWFSGNLSKNELLH
jgi:hypothetical protein